MKTYLPRIKQSFALTNGDFDKFQSKLRSLNISSDANHLFSDGIYVAYVKRWLRVFPPDRLLIFDGDEIFHDPGLAIEQLQDFVRIPKLLRRKDFVRHPKSGLYCLRPWWRSTYDFAAEYRQDDTWGDALSCLSQNKGKTRSPNAPNPITQRIRIALGRFYQPYNNMLYELLGRTFLWQ